MDPRSDTASPAKLEASRSCVLGYESARPPPPPATGYRRARARPPPPRSRRGPAEPPAPGTAASITFMPRLPKHRPAGMQGGRAAGGCVPVSPAAGAPAPPARCKHTPAGGGRLGRGAAPWQPGRKRKRGGQGRHVGGGLTVMLRGSRSRRLTTGLGLRAALAVTPPQATPLPDTADEVLHLWDMLAPSNFLGMQRREMNCLSLKSNMEEAALVWPR